MAATNTNVELRSKYRGKIYMKSVIKHLKLHSLTSFSYFKTEIALVSEILKNPFYGLTGLESDGLAVFILSKTAQA